MKTLQMTFLILLVSCAQKPVVVLPTTDPYDRTNIERTTYNGVPTDILDRLIMSESSWDHKAVNRTAWEYSVGLAQINMDYFSWFKERYGIQDPFCPRQSLEFASRYLYDLYQRFGSWELAVIAYKVGPSKVRKAPDWIRTLSRRIAYGE